MDGSGIDVRKGIKRPNSESYDQNLGQDVQCEQPINKFEQSEAKRWRAYSDFYNSDTGATFRYFRFRFFSR